MGSSAAPHIRPVQRCARCQTPRRDLQCAEGAQVVKQRSSVLSCLERAHGAARGWFFLPHNVHASQRYRPAQRRCQATLPPPPEAIHCITSASLAAVVRVW